MYQEHVLVSSVGLGQYEQTTYVLDGVGESGTDLSPVALAEILDIDRAFIPRTEAAAEKADEQLSTKFDSMDTEFEFQEIPKIGAAEDVDSVLDLFVSEFTDETTQRVSLDITHSYRSLVMVLFASLAYLDALDEVDIEGIYYGEFQKGRDESPLIDITYLYTLMDWYYGLRSFDRTGSLRAVAALLEEKKADLFKSGKHPEEFAELAKRVRGVNRSLDTGLPLETGTAASSALETMEGIDESEFVGPEGAVLEPLEDALTPFGLEQTETGESGPTLDMAELQRQAEIVSFYSDRGRYRMALSCARELFLNRILYESEPAYRENWLDKSTRQTAKQERLHRVDDAYTTGETSDALGLWNRLGTYRNYYAHGGFDADQNAPAEEKIETAIETLCKKIDDSEYWEELK